MFKICSLGFKQKKLPMSKERQYVTELFNFSRSDFPELGVKDLQHQRALFEAIYPLKSNSLILKRSLAKLDDSLAGIPV